MTITRTFDSRVKIILDSISPDGIRLPTVQFRQPRMIHADFMTHRVFSRNARSSRAVPVVTLLEEAKNPYVPHFLKNQPGMAAAVEFTEAEFAEAEHIWREMAEFTRMSVERLNRVGGTGVHKQWANRPLEWFGYIDVLLTATDWENYFALRQDGGAQPEIQQIAADIHIALDLSTPTLLQPGEWHLPYIEDIDWRTALYMQNATGVDAGEILKKISTARCARLTIKPFDGDGTFEAELARYDKLMVSRPVHASPAEHQATPDQKVLEKVFDNDGHWIGEDVVWQQPELHGNFRGWLQNRKQIPDEFVADAA